MNAIPLTFSTADSTIARLEAEILDSPAPRVPRLFCSFLPAVHPEVDHVQARSVAWAAEMGLVAGERAIARVAASKIGWLVSRAHPEGAIEPLQIAADWTTLFCLLDDRIERIEEPAGVVAYLDEILAVARGAMADDDPCARAMADVRRRLATVAAPAALARVEARIAELFEAFGIEAELRARREIPSHPLYIPMRAVTVGIPVELAIGELVDGIALPDQARDRGAAGLLARKASNLVGWSNDVYTFEKELRSGEVCNLVAVLAQARGIGLADAVAGAAVMHDEEARVFAALTADLAAIGHPEVRRYARLLQRWVRGHLDWARETGRYGA